MSIFAIPRDLFYRTLKDSPNLSYVEEIDGFKKSKSPVNLYEVMKRLDLFDIRNLAIAVDNWELADFIADTWFTWTPEDEHVISWEGFDCYYPPELRRDFLIKKFLKDGCDAPDGMKPDFSKHKQFVDIFNPSLPGWQYNK